MTKPTKRTQKATSFALSNKVYGQLGELAELYQEQVSRVVTRLILERHAIEFQHGAPHNEGKADEQRFIQPPEE